MSKPITKASFTIDEPLHGTPRLSDLDMERIRRTPHNGCIFKTWSPRRIPKGNQMKQYETIKELYVAARDLGACEDGLDRMLEFETIEEYEKEVSIDDRVWLLARGLPQFSVHCDWGKLSGGNWSHLFIHQPHLSVHCGWETHENN